MGTSRNNLQDQSRASAKRNIEPAENIDGKAFDSAARFYRAYRKDYPTEIFDFLRSDFELDASKSILDLGCGTGQLALPLALLGAQVFAVDPDAEMLKEGQKEEKLRVQSGIKWFQGSDQSIAELLLPPLTLCTMGASFHWMNRAQVLTDLDRLVLPLGGVAVISGYPSAWSAPESGWRPVARAVIQEFLGEKRRVGVAEYYDHPKAKHQEIIAQSPFPELTIVNFTDRESLTVEQVIGLQLSTSYAAPIHFGSRLTEFKERLALELYAAEPSGQFYADIDLEVIIARRRLCGQGKSR